MEYMELVQRVIELEQELSNVESERENVRNDKAEMQTMHNTNQREHARASEEIGATQE
jgi:hypothetical protein